MSKKRKPRCAGKQRKLRSYEMELLDRFDRKSPERQVQIILKLRKWLASLSVLLFVLWFIFVQ